VKSLVRAMVAFVVGLGAVALHASPAAAAGQNFSVVTVTNGTSLTLQISSHTPDAWGTQGTTPVTGPYKAMPDGSPPAQLAPGDTMYFGTKSNGKTGATSGNGGTLTIPLGTGADIPTATLQWSNPWELPGVGGCGFNQSASVAVPSGGFPSPTPFTATGAITQYTDSSCSIAFFAFTVGGGAPGPTMTQGELVAGQSMSPPTSCPSGVTCSSGIHSLTSADGSTTLWFDTAYFGSGPSSWGGNLKLTGPNGTWSGPWMALLEMQPGGNLVGYDAGGNVVWSTGTSSAGDFLEVGTNDFSVLWPTSICTRFGCRFVGDEILWKALATSGTNQ
jgi:hypothetical protein